MGGQAADNQALWWAPEIAIYYLFWHLHQQSKPGKVELIIRRKRKGWNSNETSWGLTGIYGVCIFHSLSLFTWLKSLFFSLPRLSVFVLMCCLLETSFAHFTKTLKRVIRGVTTLDTVKKSTDSAGSGWVSNMQYRYVFIENDNWLRARRNGKSDRVLGQTRLHPTLITHKSKNDIKCSKHQLTVWFFGCRVWWQTADTHITRNRYQSNAKMGDIACGLKSDFAMP